MADSSPIIEFELKQQTPMIHFQYDQDGVCLRASEVKPKFDRYIIDKVGETKIPSDWYISNEHPALNYKMKIMVSGCPKVSHSIEAQIKLNEENDKGKKKPLRAILKSQIHELYFGNMTNSVDPDEIKKVFKETVFYEGTIKLIIICFDEKLRQKIRESFPSFLAITNFGTRQDKGFGSFYLADQERDPINDVKDSGKLFYYFEENDTKKILDDIQLVYGFMKSGFNYTNQDNGEDTNYIKGYIFQYFLNQTPEVNNDKAFSKQNVLRLKTYKESIDSNNSAYVRGILGVSEGVNYRTYKNPNHNVRILSADGTVQRFASPITFKIIGKYVFIILEDCSLIQGKKFFFVSDKECKDKTIDDIKREFPNREIAVPDKFDLYVFMDSFINAFNDKNYAWGYTIGTQTAITMNNVTDRRLKRAKSIIIKGEI